jgi:hypothetical protein
VPTSQPAPLGRSPGKDFTITPVDTDTATALRMDIADGRIAAERVLLTAPGAPCRQCLRPGEVGELMVCTSTSTPRPPAASPAASTAPLDPAVT